jgi:hypothetical protein
VRKLLLSIGAMSLAATVAQAQINQLVGTPPNATNVLNFDTPLVASGPIASNSSVFTAVGIASVTQFGSTWTIAGDTITAGSNGSGQSLVVTGNTTGVLSVAGIGQALSNTGAGPSGFEVTLAADATEFGVLFIDQINFSYSVELFDNNVSLGVGNFSYSGSFPAPAHYWTGPGAFDRIKIAFVGSIGVGIDNFAFNVVSSGPVSYCTAGTSTAGCNATLTASAQPSVTQANPCVLTTSNVEGQKSGILFYGIDNTGYSPAQWGTGSSFLCVKAPTQRTTTQSSGGTLGLCDGVIALDWNAYQLANPTSLGNPFVAGAKVYAQCWYRDPPASKTTSLSDAVEMTYAP